MKMTKTVVMALAAALATVCASCGDSESYANRLNTERNSCNSYLTTKRVENNIPADTVFETGEDAPCYFIYSDFTLPMSSQWGYGLQLPLEYVGVDSEINLLVKSQFGLTSEISYVQPYVFHIRYFRSHI